VKDTVEKAREVVLAKKTSRIEESIKKKLGPKVKLDETEFEVILLDGV